MSPKPEKAKEEKIAVIRREWCKGCGICRAFCPKKCLEGDHEGKTYLARPEDCIGCGLCAVRCPDLAIELENAGEESHEQ